MLKKGKTKITIFYLTLITIFYVSIFASFVAAAHTQESLIKPEFAKRSVDIEYAVTVTNVEGDDIKRVIIQIPPKYPSRTCGKAPDEWALRPDGTDECIYTTTKTENFISAGESLTFFVDSTTASLDDTYTWLVTTRDVELSNSRSQPTTKVDGTAPEVSITFPEEESWNKDIISVEHEESDDNLDSDSCSFNVNGGADTSIECNEPFNFKTSNCEDGENTCTIEITALDLAGNTNSDSVTFSVDNSPPTITFVSLSDDTVQSGTTITITSDGADPQGLKSCVARLLDLNNIIIKKWGNLGNDCSGDRKIPIDVVDGDYKVRVIPKNNANTTAFAETPITIDNTAPSIQSVDLNPNNALLRVGDSVDVTITEEFGETRLIASGSYNGIELTWTDNSNGKYTATYTVSEGDSDGTNVEIIDATLTDVAGNSDTDASSGNTVSIDANSPSISSVTLDPSTGLLGVGNEVEITITEANGEAGLTATGTYNGVELAFVDKGGGTYTATYTVVEGDPAGTNVEITDATLTDAADNSDTDASSGNTVSIDANSPIILSVTLSPSSGLFGVGDSLEITITEANGEAGLTATGTYNTVLPLIFADNGNGIYTATYTVAEGDPDGTDVEITDATLTDAAGNSGTGKSSGNTVSIDAHTPVFISTESSDPDTIYKNVDTITFVTKWDAADYIVTADFSGVDSKYTTGDETVTDNGDSTYTVSYTISNLNMVADTSGIVVPVRADDGVNTATDNSFTVDLDNTAPTTFDNSVEAIQVPPYIVTVTPGDALSGVKSTFFCIDQEGTCNPLDGKEVLESAPFDVTFDSNMRGLNHLRYLSKDIAGNQQDTVDKTVNINQLPVASDLMLTPTEPTTTDDLMADYTYSDADNDPESGTTEIRWFKNGVLQIEFNDVLLVPASATSKEEVWHFTVKPNDGREFGDKQTSDTVKIQNTPPTAPVIDLIPDEPLTTDDLVATIITESTDVDGDEVTLSFAWFKDGDLQDGLTTDTVSSDLTAKGEVWKVIVIPNDGTDDGPSATDEVTILNSAPTISPITSQEATAGQFFELQVEATDPDGDVLTFTLSEEPEGMEIDSNGLITWTPTNAQALANSFNVEVLVSDGDLEATPQSFTIEVVSYEIKLVSGINFISIPLVPANTDVEVVFANVLLNLEVIWAYDPLQPVNKRWSFFSPSNSHDSIGKIVPGKGYYAKMNEADTLRGDGEKMFKTGDFNSPPPGEFTFPPTITLAGGWNAIGHYGILDIEKKEALSNLLTDHATYGSLIGSNGNPVKILKPTDGYWLFIKCLQKGDEQCTIEYAPSEESYSFE